MYSLGIILFELCFPFKTDMERLIEINNLKTDENYFNKPCLKSNNELKAHVSIFLNKITLRLIQKIVFYLKKNILVSSNTISFEKKSNRETLCVSCFK
jgi:hypothetical protein